MTSDIAHLHTARSADIGTTQRDGAGHWRWTALPDGGA
jgi:hypothetical protein